LNNRKESRARGFVTNLQTQKKFFTNSLRSIAAKAIFQSASRRYGDKWLVKRGFSRLFFRVTLTGAVRKKTKPDSAREAGIFASCGARSNRREIKSPAMAGLFSETLLRSVHFASFAI
jgi:hypothetical protein